VKTCSNCGAQFPDNDLNCPNCGLPEFLSQSVSVSEEIPEDDLFPEYDETDYPVFRKRRKHISVFALLSILVVFATAGIAIYSLVLSPLQKYNRAAEAFEAGDYQTALTGFEGAAGFRDSKERAAEAYSLLHYTNGKTAYESGDFEKAKAEFSAAGNYKDSAELALESERAGRYAKAVSMLSAGQTDEAIEELKLLGDYKDSRDLIFSTLSGKGDQAVLNGDFEKAAEYYGKAGEYGSIAGKELYISYGLGLKAVREGNYEQAAGLFEKTGDYMDSAEQLQKCYSHLVEKAVAANDLETAAKYLAKSGLQTSGVNANLRERCYSLGIEALDKKDYGKAAEFLKAAGDYKDAKQKGKQAFYMQGTVLMKAGSYLEASNYFQIAGDYKDSKALRKECVYLRAVAKFEANELDEAIAIFKQLGDYKYAKELIKVCNAESYYATGLLNEAAAAYSKVSTKASVTGFNIQARRASVITEAALSKMKGEWTAKSNNAYANVVYNFGWRKKTKNKGSVKGLVDGQDLWFGVRENLDGTFDITIQVTYFCFKSYSRRYVKDNMGISSAVKTFVRVRTLPSTFKLSSNLTLKYSKGEFILEHARDVKKSKKKKVVYRSIVKYRRVA
jgi:tetratricopeptide (TPR) repeat protein